MSRKLCADLQVQKGGAGPLMRDLVVSTAFAGDLLLGTMMSRL